MDRDDFCNFFVNWIPVPRVRKGIYRSLGMQIHSSAHIMRSCHFVRLKNIQIGKRSIIGHHCFLDGKGHIFIGDDVNISSYAKIATAKHIVNDSDFRGVDKPITIGDRAWVAMAAIILQGIEIGEAAVVAAGSVVTKNVEPYTVVGGVPARQIGERCHGLRYRLNSKPSRFL